MRSVTAKTILSFSIIMLLIFSVFAIIVSQVLRQKYYSDLRGNIDNYVIRISDEYVSGYIDDGVWNREEFVNDMEIFNRYTDFHYVVTDADLNIITLSDGIVAPYKKLNIRDDEKLKKMQKGNVVWSTDMISDIFGNTIYNVAYPMLLDGEVKGYVFGGTYTSELTRQIKKLYLYVFVFLVVGLLIGYAAIYYYMYEFLAPINKVNKAARRIAGGNFDERIEFKGNDEIAQLCSSFNVMAESLCEQDKRRKEFTSNISHDLRSPLTSIKGYAEAMTDGTIPPEKYPKYLKIIYSEADRLNNLANSIMDFNTLFASYQNTTLTDYNINTVINEVVLALKERADDKKIKLKIKTEKPEIKVHSDREKIQRVIFNLADNAIKFTEKGSIEIGSFTKENKAHIYVKDTGIGLSEDEQKRVFERHYKADSSRGIDKNGMGLGLAIVKEIIEWHGENICVRSTPGRGSLFEFTLKLAEYK